MNVSKYVTNTLVGGIVGAGAGYAAPAIGSFLSSSFTIGSYALAGGQTVSIAVTGAQIAGATIVIGVLQFARDQYVEHLKSGMSQNQKEQFQREIEDMKESEGRGGKDNLSREVLKEIAEMIKKAFK